MHLQYQIALLSIIFCSQAATLFRPETVNAVEVDAILESLQMATAVESPDDPSQFPQDLGTTNNVLDMSLDFLMSDLASNPSDPLGLSVVSTY